ncbi:MAG: DUF2970 domain-containing protein [Pseudomonadales bacterium]|nr:DUF2970 domain-containing protein [Pseudomonadales bacterium]MDA0761414.1 DUF2970 domain-containing protein [Pseudomonadota bacterium]MDA0957500.1 DUF2970 domain-containing protein [Pseudomonadota bacterium]MDA1206871.1 DUF2970 domain-containing protein [Pseudomonadota bacterium]
MTDPEDHEYQKAPSFFQAFLSVISAAIGVQRSERRTRDFQSSSPLIFIIAGLVFTILFIATLLGIVFLII